MKKGRKTTFVFVALGLLLIFVAALAHAKLPTPKSGDPMALFNHDNHHGYFATLNYGCEKCHKDQTTYAKDQVNKMGCHDCHNNPSSPSKKARRFKCITCHKNLKTVTPEDHYLDWTNRHQVAAKQDKKGCMKCHKGYYCTSCHQSRDTIDQRAHRRNYRYYHSIEARSNPHKCDDCHSVSYCTRCHSRP